MIDKTQLRPFEELEQGERHARRIFALRQDRVRSASTGRDLVVDRLFAPDWVNVVAFDDDGHLLLVRQWRFGAQAFSIELPSGVMERGEEPVAAALRELVEETGHTPVDPAAVVVLGATRPNAAFMDNRCHTVFVPHARKTHEVDFDPSEEIELLRAPRDAVDELLRHGTLRCSRGEESADGHFDGALGLVALHLWKLHSG